MGVVCKKTSLCHLIAEKIPLFALVAVSCVVTFIVQQHEGAVRTLERYTLTVRINNALASYIKYIGKMIWPRDLAVLYPHPGPLAAWKPITALVILVGVSVAVIYMVRRRHELAPIAMGWLWYLGTLVPVIGLVQVGSQAMADRYTYIPSIGFVIMVTWGIAGLYRGLRHREIVFGILTALLLIIWTLCTRAQVGYWKNNLALFRHSVEATRNSYIAHYHYAHALFKDGYIDEAALHLQEAIRIGPRHMESYGALAKAFYEQGRIDETIAVCTKRLRMSKPDPAVYHMLGQAYTRKSAYGPAVQSFKECLQLDPDSVSTHENFAKVVMRLNDPDAAIRHLTEAIQLNPNIALTHHALARALKSKGRTEEAITHFREALRIKPNWEKPMNRLAWILATHSDSNLRDPQEALSLALRACELADYQAPGFLDTLAAAYAAAGRFADAVDTAEKAVQLTASGDKKQRHQAILNRLDLYRQQKPYRQPPYTPKKRME
jgi:tetratricopeptide (TPR) repeat protein